ncbi:MAG: hypothetical protein ACOYLB_14700 [Phototrophicaceae bacterium]
MVHYFIPPNDQLEPIYISPIEWRWVMVVSVLLVFVTTLPILIGITVATLQPSYSFMGVMVNYYDGATYLSKIQQGVEGSLTVGFRHSPLETDEAYLWLLYATIGQVARVFNLSNGVAFHLFRVLFGLLMFLGLYQLGATIWQRQRSRRIFFLVVSLGSGLGWAFLPFVQSEAFPDLAIPEAYPFYSVAANVHFPFALMLISFAVNYFIRVFRPGVHIKPTIRNGGLMMILTSIGLAISAPHVLLSMGLALFLLILIGLLLHRKIKPFHVGWFSLFVLPSTPFAVYYLGVIRFNPTFSLWNAQNITLSPALWIYLVGFAIPLLVAMPGIYRALRHFEADGDQLMVLWLVVILALVYFPSNGQRRFSMGLMIPLAYFAMRSLEDFWFRWVAPERRMLMGMLTFAMMCISQLLLVVIWIAFALNPMDSPVFLSRNYDDAFKWLQQHPTANGVVLASSEPSLWIPTRTSFRVVYGHPFETIHAVYNQQRVEAFFAHADSDTAICEQVLQEFEVVYVVVGQLEQLTDQPSTCLATLQLRETFGDVAIYQP